jgi:hypothetical protein
MDHPIRADCHAGSSGAWLRHCAPRGGNVRPGPAQRRGPVPSSRRTAAGNGPNPTASRRRCSPRRRSRATPIFSSRFWVPLTPIATATGAGAHGQRFYHYLAFVPGRRRAHPPLAQFSRPVSRPAEVTSGLSGLQRGARLACGPRIRSRGLTQLWTPPPLKERLLDCEGKAVTDAVRGCLSTAVVELAPGFRSDGELARAEARLAETSLSVWPGLEVTRQRLRMKSSSVMTSMS